MPRWVGLGRFVLALLLLALLPTVAWARPVPALVAHVNDTADLLSPAAEQALEQKLASYEQATQHQFALLTVDSLDGDPVEDFSIRVVEQWKLGKKGKDDGLLLLIAVRERKLRIEVGYGLEGDITDAFSSRVIRQVLSPQLRAGAAEGGISQAFDVLMKKASGDAVPDSAMPPEAKRAPLSDAMRLLAILAPIVLMLLLARSRAGRAGLLVGGLGGFGRRDDGWSTRGGGGFGGFGGGGGGGGGGFSGGGGGFGGGGGSGSW